MFIALMNEGSVTPIDSALLHEDSISVDSVEAYGIPEVITFGFHPKSIKKNLYISQDITPLDYDFTLTDVFFHTPFTLVDYGNGQSNKISRRGQDATHTMLYLNNHRASNPLFSCSNLTVFPVQFIENISVNGDYYGRKGTNLSSKVNHYDRPFSHVRFTTGDFQTSIYNIDFTRPITNDFGIYCSGIYWNTNGHRANNHVEISSLYSNLYYNQIIPMRFDISYFSSDYGLPGDDLDTLDGLGQDELIDAGFVCGFKNHHIVFYYTASNNQYTTPLLHHLYSNEVRTYGIESENYRNINGFEIIYRLMGQMDQIDSDVYGSHTVHSADLLVALHKSFKRLCISLYNKNELKTNNALCYAPQISAAYDLYDSTFIFGTISRDYRLPSVSEKSYADAPLLHYYIQGNPDLLPENYWGQIVGIQGKKLRITFFKCDYDNLIVLKPDSDNLYTPRNIETWQSVGVESYLLAQIRLEDTPIARIITDVDMELTGSYFFKGDSLPFIPRFNSNISLSIRRETDKFALGGAIRGCFVGRRYDINGQDINSFKVFSVVGMVRFATLSFILNVDNILGEDYAYVTGYTMPPRHINFTVKWDFWD